MTVKSVFVHKAGNEEVMIINPDVVYTVTKDDMRMIRYHTSHTLVTVYQKRNGDGEYIDEAINIVKI
jgi:hypothetical protein